MKSGGRANSEVAAALPVTPSWYLTTVLAYATSEYGIESDFPDEY